MSVAYDKYYGKMQYNYRCCAIKSDTKSEEQEAEAKRMEEQVRARAAKEARAAEERKEKQRQEEAAAKRTEEQAEAKRKQEEEERKERQRQEEAAAKRREEQAKAAEAKKKEEARAVIGYAAGVVGDVAAVKHVLDPSVRTAEAIQAEEQIKELEKANAEAKQEKEAAPKAATLEQKEVNTASTDELLLLLLLFCISVAWLSTDLGG